MVRVLPMTEEIVPSVCRLHRVAFRGLMSARLGASYLCGFVSWFLRAQRAIALVATDDDGKLLGYVIGAPVGYGASMNRDLMWVAARSMIVRPWLFLNSQVRATVRARLRVMLGRTTSDTHDLPTPTMSLVGIAVSPEAAGNRVGSMLVEAFENRACALKMASMQLSVYPGNMPARRLYERRGWQALNVGSSTGAIYYGRVLNAAPSNSTTLS
jgi:ribosomal protein S18 acetylase RimI-like enzyme